MEPLIEFSESPVNNVMAPEDHSVECIAPVKAPSSPEVPDEDVDGPELICITPLVPDVESICCC